MKHMLYNKLSTGWIDSQPTIDAPDVFAMFAFFQEFVVFIMFAWLITS